MPIDKTRTDKYVVALTLFSMDPEYRKIIRSKEHKDLDLKTPREENLSFVYPLVYENFRKAILKDSEGKELTESDYSSPFQDSVSFSNAAVLRNPTDYADDCKLNYSTDPCTSYFVELANNILS